MKIQFTFLLFFCGSISLLAQLTPADFGFRHLTLPFEGDTVHILVKSRKGEENLKKPIYFAVQGSLAVPLIVHNGDRRVRYSCIADGFVEEDYHLAIVNKPGIPLVAHRDSLSKRDVYKNKATGKHPMAFLEKNYLDYYVRRNHAVIQFLHQQSWVDTTQLIASGHSEGSTIVAYMGQKIPSVTHVIYSGGTPYLSRISSMLAQERRQEKEVANPWVTKTIEYWKDVVKHPLELNRYEGWNTHSGTYSFSQDEDEILKNLTIPTLVAYGTKDEGAPYVDLFHLDCIRDKVNHITFQAYVGLDHNYSNVYDSSKDELESIVQGWLDWIKENK